MRARASLRLGGGYEARGDSGQGVGYGPPSSNWQCRRGLHVWQGKVRLNGCHTRQFAYPSILFDCVHWVGAAYLMWLAWKILSRADGDATEIATETGAGWAAIQRGVLTNLLNPKALMFCALLLPQFVSTQHDLAAQYLILGSVLVGLGALFDVTYALAASSIAKRFSGSRSIRKISTLAFSGIFGFAAIRLAIGGS